MGAPSRLQIGTTFEQAIPLLNNNFDQVVQDIRDLGANLSTTGTLTVTVPATSLKSAVFTLTSQGQTSNSVNQVFTQSPVSQVSGIAPQTDIYIDNDNDPTYLFPNGSNLTAVAGAVGNTALYAIVTVSEAGYTNSLAAWIIQINNRDSASHTYYLHTRCGYLPTGPSGNFR